MKDYTDGRSADIRIAACDSDTFQKIVRLIREACAEAYLDGQRAADRRAARMVRGFDFAIAGKILHRRTRKGRNENER